MKTFIYLSVLWFFCSVAVFGGVIVTKPAGGGDIQSPFTLIANASVCSSQTVTSMSYSLDSGSEMGMVEDVSLETEIAAGVGQHTVHVKAHGDRGALCVTDVMVKVTATPELAVPSNAVTTSNMQTYGNWHELHDKGTPGSSSGEMAMVGSPSRGGATRRFITHFSHSGGERYYLTFGDDTTATHFVYDTWLYIGGSASSIANLEMDLNQVIENGWTVIYGFQCDGYDGRWDFTVNEGSPSHPKDHWVATSAPCNPRSWAVNKWHHIQISYSRNNSGIVTYESITFDGKTWPINRSVLSAFALHWGDVLMTNFQVDGLGGGGTNTIYMDSFTIQRW